MKMKRKGKEIVAWLCVLTLLVGCIADWGIGSLESKAADTADTGYTELTISDFFASPNQILTSGGVTGYRPSSITTWDNVAINATIVLPVSGTSDIRIASILMKNGGGNKVHMCTIDNSVVSDGLQGTDLGYAGTDTTNGTDQLRDKKVPIRLTFDASEDGTTYLVTLEGTGESGQKAITTMTVPSSQLSANTFKVNRGNGDIAVYSESIKTSKDTYTSEEPIQATVVSQSGDWVGVFEESATTYTKETAKAWYSVADYNGTAYDMPAQEAGNYKVCLIMNESTVLLSKEITVEQYVEAEYTELTFSNFGLKDNTYAGYGADSAASITTWDYVTVSGTIKLPATGGSYIRFGGSAVNKGVEIKYGNAEKIHMGVTATNQGWASEGLQRSDMGYADTDTVANKEILIRLTFEPDGNNYLITLEGMGESGQKDTATMTVPKDVLNTYKMYVYSSAADKEVSIYSESIKTSKDTYTSEEPIQTTAVSQSADWVGIFEESATTYTKETAKAWYNVADYDGTAYDIPKQVAGNYRVCLIMNDSTVLLSKEITVEQYVEVKYTELTFSDFGLKDYTYSGSGADSAGTITSWDHVVVSGTIKLPATGGSYIRFGGSAVNKGVEIKYGNAEKIHMGVTATNQGWASEGLQRDDMGLTDTVADKEIFIRLIVEPNGNNYLITLEGTGESGQKDTATMTVPKDVFNTYKMYVYSSAADKEVSIYSESIKTSKDTYTSEETIQATAVSQSADWVGIFEESATTYTKETAKAWYNVADYDGTAYNIPKQVAGNYIVCLIMNDSTVLLSKEITVTQYVEKTYTELTFRNFGQEDRTVTASSQGTANITSWDNVAISGKIKLPATGGSYISFGGNAVDKGVQIKYGGEDKIHMGVVYTTHTDWVSAGLQRADMGYADTETLAGKEIAIRLIFELANDGENYIVTLEGTGESGKKDTATMTIAKDAVPVYRMDIIISSTATDKNITIASVSSGTGGEGGAESEVIIRDTPLNPVTSYKEVTFKDFLMGDGPIPDYAITGGVATLEGRVFKGIITFPEKGGGYLIVGGTEKNAWYGVRVGASADGLYLFETANGSQRWEISTETIGRSTVGEALELWLTFTYVDEHNVYVGVYVDGKFCGEKLFKNLVQPFESKLLVYSPQNEMIIASAETAWNKLLNSKVNFAYWGFTDNWKEELAEICK